jgi:Leucine-rich repeat (LRR) protein
MLNTHHSQRLTPFIGLAAGLFTGPSLTQAATDCATVTQIPQTECAALIDLYNSTNGPHWTNNSGWHQTNTPCDWQGITCRDGHVTRLNLYNNQLSGTLPASLGNLNRLEKLSLAFNQIGGPVPASLGNLSHLQSLTLYSNQLSGAIPESLGNLAQLQKLSLGYNQFSGTLPDFFNNFKELWYLYLQNNQLIGTMPESLGTLDELRSFSLYRNQINGTIPDFLGNLTQLQHLRLYNNQLSGPIPTALGKMTQLQTLRLHNNELSETIPLSLMNLSQLSKLKLDNNHLTASDLGLINWLNNLNPTWATTQKPICLVYGLHDGGLNNSQFFTVNPKQDFKVNALGDTHIGHDLEGMDIHPETRELYASSGDDPAVGLEPGYLYQVNKSDGTLTPVCSTGLGEVSAMSFHPQNHSLWVWADGQGLFMIDINKINHGVCDKTEIVPHAAKVEAIAWDLDGNTLYGASGTVLYKYQHGAVAEVCHDFPSEVEALDILADGSLLFGLHDASDTSIHSFDIGGCSVKDSVPLPVNTPYTDIEGITWRCP